MSNDYRVEHGRCGDSIERIGHPGEAGLVECPTCFAEVRESDIGRDGKCPECPDEEEEG